MVQNYLPQIKATRPLAIHMVFEREKLENKEIKENLRQVFEILHHQQLFTESVRDLKYTHCTVYRFLLDSLISYSCQHHDDD